MGSETQVRITPSNDSQLNITSSLDASFRAHKATVTALVVHSPEILISSSRDGTIKIWNTRDWSCKHDLHGHSDVVNDISTHNDRLVSGSYDGTCKLWDVESGEELYELKELPARIRSVAFDGDAIVAGGVGGELQCWGAGDGALKSVQGRGHASLISSLYIKDGMVVTAGADGMLKAWSPHCINELWAVKAHPYAVNSVQIRDELIVTGGSDDLIKVWRLADGALLEQLGSRSRAVWNVGFATSGPQRVIQAYWNEGAVLDILEFRV